MIGHVPLWAIILVFVIPPLCLFGDFASMRSPSNYKSK